MIKLKCTKKINEQEQNKKMGYAKGITLISLVITIIILIILAGVSINLVLGENGLFTKAREAKEKFLEAQEEEQEGLNTLLDEMDNYINEKLQIEIINGTLGENNWYTSDVELRIVNRNENDTTKYILTGATTQEETEIENGKTIQIENNGITKITVKSYGEDGTQTYEIEKNIYKDSEVPTIEIVEKQTVEIGTSIDEEYIKNNSTIKDNLTEVKIVDLNIKDSSNKIIEEAEKQLNEYDIYTINFKIKDEAGNIKEVEQKITTKPKIPITLKNIIPDSGFETGINGWYNCDTIESATDKSMSGKSLKYTLLNKQAFARKNYGDLGIAGKNIYCSIYVMSDSQTTWPDFGVASTNTPDEWPTEISFDGKSVSSLEEAYGKWIKLSFILTKEKTQWNNLLITLAQNDVNGTGTLWWDNMMIIDLSPFDDKVPTTDWLDNMIPYTESNQIFTLNM